MPNYHFRLPDGQELGWNGSVAKLRKEHPDAIITGRVKMDALGQGRLVAYQGEQLSAANNDDDVGPLGEVTDEQLAYVAEQETAIRDRRASRTGRKA